MILMYVYSINRMIEYIYFVIWYSCNICYWCILYISSYIWYLCRFCTSVIHIKSMYVVYPCYWYLHMSLFSKLSIIQVCNSVLWPSFRSDEAKHKKDASLNQYKYIFGGFVGSPNYTYSFISIWLISAEINSWTL